MAGTTAAPAADGPRDVTDGGGEEAILTAAVVARLVGGTLAPDADPTRVVRRMAPLDRADGEAVSFLASGKYAAQFAGTAAGVVLLAPELADVPAPAGVARVLVAKPHEAMLALLPALYRPAPRTPGIHPTAVIGRGVTMGAAPQVGPYVVIGDGAVLGDRVTLDAHVVVGAGVVLGDDVRIFPHVTLYAGAVLGKRVMVQAGARIASDGFGYVFGEGQHRKIPHVGRCVLEDDVEIGANTTVDRGSIGDTVIGAGSKLDNLVMVGHNCRIGRLCLLMSQVGVAGSTVVEDGVILAGQAGLAGHITIGKGARIAAQAGVIGDVPAGATYSGYPARPHREAMKGYAAAARLAGLLKPLERLLAREAARGEGAPTGGAGA